MGRTAIGSIVAAAPLKSRRDLRLASGLVLFTYVTLHLTCHAFGLVSLGAAEASLGATLLIWHSGIGTVLLYGAAAVHVGLALLAIYDRRTLRMPPDHALRIVMGLTMPVVLIGHFVGTRYAFERFGLPAEYHRLVANLWATGGQDRQLALLAPGWLHGCLGLNFAFGSRRLWRRLRFLLFGAALLLPVLAGLGFLTMGRELAERPTVADAHRAPAAAAQAAALVEIQDEVLAAYLCLIGIVAMARMARSLNERRRKSVVRISYPGRSVTVPRSWTVLEASRSFDIPHQSMCGGRARCKTCRVRVTDGESRCPPPGIDEGRALDRIDAGADVRLACQLRPAGDISVQPLLAVEHPWWRAAPPAQQTTEREVAVLFCDVRNGMGSASSAHDTIYGLDRFHAIFGAAIEAAGGVQCRHAGDSWMALFGLKASSLGEACRQALVAAQQIDERSAVLTERLARELAFDADLSIGVHAGRVVAGVIGDLETRRLSAVGDAVRATGLLQAFAHQHAARLVISRTAADATGIDGVAFDWWAVSGGTEGAGAPMLCAALPARDLASALPHPP